MDFRGNFRLDPAINELLWPGPYTSRLLASLGNGLLCIKTKRMEAWRVTRFLHTLLKARCTSTCLPHLAGFGSPKKETLMNADLRFPIWQEPLLSALMETNHENLRRKIETAKQAILERRSDVVSVSTRAHIHDDASNISTCLREAARLAARPFVESPVSMTHSLTAFRLFILAGTLRHPTLDDSARLACGATRIVIDVWQGWLQHPAV